MAERLPCLATAQPAPAAISAAVVETLNVGRPPPVPAVSIRSSRPACTGVANARIVVRQADELVDRLALRAQRDQHAGGLDLGGVAGHDLGQHRGGLLGATGPGATSSASIALVRTGLGKEVLAAVACRRA